MKKKIKDLTLEEMNKICKKQFTCRNCPLKSSFKTCIKYWGVYLEREVEVDE